MKHQGSDGPTGGKWKHFQCAGRTPTFPPPGPTRVGSLRGPTLHAGAWDPWLIGSPCSAASFSDKITSPS